MRYVNGVTKVSPTQRQKKERGLHSFPAFVVNVTDKRYMAKVLDQLPSSVIVLSHHTDPFGMPS
eukprot:951756-Amphidinium_carterae.1